MFSQLLVFSRLSHLFTLGYGTLPIRRVFVPGSAGPTFRESLVGFFLAAVTMVSRSHFLSWRLDIHSRAPVQAPESRMPLSETRLAFLPRIESHSHSLSGRDVGAVHLCVFADLPFCWGAFLYILGPPLA